MLDDFRRAMEDLQKMPEGSSQRNYAMTWLVVYCLLMLARYAITGWVVFALGRRIINAFVLSMKPAEGERS